MSVDLGAWEMSTVIDLATDIVRDDVVQAIRDELYQRASGSSLFGQQFPISISLSGSTGEFLSNAG